MCIRDRSSGVITTNATLAVGTYTVGGTTTDPDGDTGTFSYTLTVTAGTLTKMCIRDRL